MIESFYFNDTLTDAIVQQRRELANEIERRLELWLNDPNWAALDLRGGKVRPLHAYYCRASDSGTQSIPSATNTLITLDTDDYDADGWHSTSTNTERITPTIAGWYRCTAAGGFTGSMASGDRVILYMTKSGTTIGGVDRDAGSTATPDLVVTADAHFDGDTEYLNSLVFQGNAAARTWQANFLSMELIVADS